jgi:Fe-S cluster assembly protein SufD
MQQAVERDHPATAAYADDFRRRRKERLGEPVWLIERRQEAMAGFEASGFPSRRQEAWRNLDVTPLLQSHFEAVHVSGDAEPQAKALAQLLPEAYLLVFVDGHFSEAHSRLPQLKGVELRPLHAALAEDAAVLSAHLGRCAEVDAHAFGAINTGLFEDGALLHVGRGVVVDRPMVLAYLNSEEAVGRAVHPRTLIVAEEGAQVQVAELHQGGEGAYLSTAVTEIFVGANASVQHHKLQEEGTQAFHLGMVGAHLERDARLSVYSFSSGAKLARTDITVDLTGPGAEVELDGLYLTQNGQYNDHHTAVRHQVEHCNSHQRFKGVLSGKSEAVFDGLVLVAKGAQKTDARQDNRNLLLSKRALAHSNPRLEIHADDVKCSHGSSIGELDQDALFYLRSRGIGAEAAQGLLTFAFVGEMLEAVRIEALREHIRTAAFAGLPGNEIVKELA